VYTNEVLILVSRGLSPAQQEQKTMKKWLLISTASLGLALNVSAFGGTDEKSNSEGNAPSKAIDSPGKKHVVKGYVPMKAAPGSKKFEASSRIKEITLPRKVDLRSKMTKVEDQGRTSSCVANAVAGAYEYWTRMALDQDYDVSRLFIYYKRPLAQWGSG
jgi:C1A family cysteine protease